MTIQGAHNRPSLDDLTADLTVLKNQPLDVIEMLMAEAKAARDKGALASKLLQAAVETRFGPAIAGAYQAAGKDTGTVRIGEGDFEIIADRAKKVEWDQDALAAAGDRIAEAGDDPLEYLARTLTVDERKFTAWPAHIRSVFEPARTVRPGAVSIKLVRKEAA